jgi:hypothetical protein
MLEKVLPHRVSIQWRKGDLAVFHNRRFMLSPTPARNYLDNAFDNQRLLLKILVPTNRPLMGVIPSVENYEASYRVGWLADLQDCLSTVMEHVRFIKKRNSGLIPSGSSYTITSKPVKKRDTFTL